MKDRQIARRQIDRYIEDRQRINGRWIEDRWKIDKDSHGKFCKGYIKKWFVEGFLYIFLFLK